MARTGRNARFVVKFGYSTDFGHTQGVAEPRTMLKEDLEFALAMVDPFLHEKWISQISCLQRRGDAMTIDIVSDHRERGSVRRLVVIERA